MVYFSKRGRIILIAGYPIWKVLIICAGVFTGSFVDAVGGGGGLITLPSYIIAGLPVHMALGTNKLSSCIGTSASTVRYIKNGYIDWVLAVPSIVLALAGSYIGTTLQLHIDEKYLKYVLLPVLVVTAAVLIKKKSFPETAGDIARWKQMIIVWSAAFAVLGHYIGAGKMIKNGSKIVTPVILCVLALLFVKIVLELFGIGLTA